MSKSRNKNLKQKYNQMFVNKTKSELNKPTLLDIIICVHDRFDLLEKCLNALPQAATSFIYNVICVDNASVLEDANKFYSAHPELIVIRNRENVGFPRACNQGARRKNSPLLLMLNDDVILDPGSLDILVKEMDNPKTGVAGMLLVFPEYADGLNPNIRPAGKVQHIGLETNIHGKFIHQFVGWSADHPKVLAQRDVYAVTGAALLTRRTLWNKVGGFLEAYGLGTFEDCDFCLSVRELGYNIVVVPQAKGTHYTGATAEKYNIPYPMENNRMIFMQRWQKKLAYTEWSHW